MKQFITIIILAVGLFCPMNTLLADSGNLEEIKQYFELRDTISLVNLEMKRAMAHDSRSPMLFEKNAEQTLSSLLQFIDSRIQQFAQSTTPLKYHYVKKLNGLFVETRQLYGAVVVKMRTKAVADKPGSLITSGENASQPVIADSKPQTRPYFHPIDLRTLLSPALLNTSKIKVEPAIKPVATDKLPAASTKTPVVQIPDKKEIPAAPVNQQKVVQEVTPAGPVVKKPVATQPEKVQEVKPVVAIATVTAPVIVTTSIVATSTVNPAVPSVVLPRLEPVTASAAVTPPVKKTEPSVKKPEPVKPVERVEVVKPAAIAPAGEGFMRPLAVMIENHNKSRPQTGLDQADMVYEMPVEGGITRFMAIFNKLPENLGPVRSCREYFIDRAIEVDALYVHCGASPLGYAYISKRGIKSIDEIKNAPPFYRDDTRKAPHNLYSKGPSLYEYMSERVPMRLKDQPVMFKKIGDVKPGTEAGQSIKIKYHGNYTLEINYEDGAYQRYMNNELHIDRITQKPLRAQTVVVQVAAMKTVDKIGRQEISFIGSGTAWIMDRGLMTKVTWHKETPRSLTSYRDMSGNEYGFSGDLPVWVQVVSPAHKIYFNGEENTPGIVVDKGGAKVASGTELIGKQG